MEIFTATPDDSSGANPSSVKSDDSSPRQEGGRGSPPPNCAICLGTCRNKSFTDSCLHQFCFKCLLTWSKVKAECPLCKQNFRSIIHNVQSNHQYEEYMVEQRTEETTERIDIDNLTTATRRFRYRTTLTLPRRESLAIQQLLLQYPLMADVFQPPAPRAPPSRRRRSPAAFRRTVYRHNLWARPLPDFTGRFRDCTPTFYRYNDSQMHRLVPWLNRELHYLLNENIGHISYVMTRILELLPQYPINSTEFKEAMNRYFGDRTEHFLHELYCFASTPYDMTGYDRNVQYTTDTRISTMVNEVISSSDSDASVDSDILIISSSGPSEPPPGPSRDVTVPPTPVFPQGYIPPPPNNVIPIETISHSDTDDDSSEVMVVGYIKPPQDRTPEVVDLLGSDSDVVVQDTTQPEPSQSSAGDAQAPVRMVKLSLTRQSSQWVPNSESDDDSSYTPPPPSRKRKRQRSYNSATTTDTCRSTPSPSYTPRENYSAAGEGATSPIRPRLHARPLVMRNRSLHRSTSNESLGSLSVSTFSSNISTVSNYSFSGCNSISSVSYSSLSGYKSSSSSSSAKKKRTVKKKKRKSRKDNAEKKKSKRTRSHHKKRSSSKADSQKDKRSKRKSHSGKGVKSSKKTSEHVIPPLVEEAATPVVEPAPPLDPQPGPSGTSTSTSKRDKKRRRTSQENKRLKSVVKVMYNNSPSSDRSPTLNSYVNNINIPMLNSISKTETGEDDEMLDVGLGESQRETKLPVEHKSNPSDSDDSDPEDNLPLNLTIHKSMPLSLSPRM